MPLFLKDGIVQMVFQNFLLSLDSDMKKLPLSPPQHLRYFISVFSVFHQDVGIRCANFFGLFEQAITFTHMLDDISI